MAPRATASPAPGRDHLFLFEPDGGRSEVHAARGEGVCDKTGRKPALGRAARSGEQLLASLPRVSLAFQLQSTRSHGLNAAYSALDPLRRKGYRRAVLGSIRQLGVVFLVVVVPPAAAGHCRI